MNNRARFIQMIVGEMAQHDRTDLLGWLLAFDMACDVLGGRLPGPLGARGFHERAVGMCLAAAAAPDIGETVGRRRVPHSSRRTS